jgi:hypothetical protein
MGGMELLFYLSVCMLGCMFDNQMVGMMVLLDKWMDGMDGMDV